LRNPFNGIERKTSQQQHQPYQPGMNPFNGIERSASHRTLAGTLVVNPFNGIERGVKRLYGS